MSIVFDVGVSQIIGDRDFQEDRFVVTDPANTDLPFDKLDKILVSVADGMGGEVGGEIASQMASEAFARYVHKWYRQYDTVDVLRSALFKSNDVIAEKIEQNSQLQGMGCTLVAAMVSRGQLYWISVGDSHLYLIRNENLIKLNENHSYGAELDYQVKAGLLDEEIAVSNPDRNALNSCIVGEDIPFIDLPFEPTNLQPDDRILLASDGLDTLLENEIIDVNNDSQSAQNFADNLVKYVELKKSPEQDNTLVVVVELKKNLAKNKNLDESMESKTIKTVKIEKPKS